MLKPRKSPARSVTTMLPNDACGLSPPPQVPVQWSDVRRNVVVSPVAALAGCVAAPRAKPTAADRVAIFRSVGESVMCIFVLFQFRKIEITVETKTIVAGRILAADTKSCYSANGLIC